VNEEAKTFLMNLLQTASPSGFEEEGARLWRAEAEKFADEVWVDVNGNSFAKLNGTGPTVVLEGHVDEIGLQVSHVDDEGYLWFQPIGGWDDQVLTGQHVRILAKDGPIIGVIGRKPRHLLSPEDVSKATKIKELWIDIGAKDGEAARARVQVGDPIVVEREVAELENGIIAGRGLDNRVGCFVALEALRRLSEDRPTATVVAMAGIQEEIGFRGAQTGAYSLEPDVAIVLDVTHATDHPDADKRGNSDVPINGGPVLARGSVVHPAVYQMLVEAAARDNISYSVDAVPKSSGTDADGMMTSRGGVPCGIVSFPCRYMHSPSELVSLNDLDKSAALLVSFAKGVGEELDLRRH
jgi:putative aminopeptidase FrvX